MIKTVHNEICISGIEMERFREPEQLTSYLASTMSRALAHFLLEKNMIYMTSDVAPYEDQCLYKGTLYIATEDDYIEQERRKQSIISSHEANQYERAGYERGVRVALSMVASVAEGMKDDRLKKNQHAAVVLIETATEVEKTLI